MPLFLLILVNIFSSCISDSLKNRWYKTVVKNNANDWIDLRFLPNAVYSEPLSTLVHSFAKRPLSFKFPFYEERLQSTLATTTGFLYMTEPRGVREPLYETKYIAPLMAGFSPTQAPPQDVRYFANGTVYINQWSDMSLETQREAGRFTFQVQLHCDGTIKFIYKSVPIPISQINSSHVVKVGISEAYERAGGVFDPSDKRLFQPYDTVELDPELVATNTTVIFTPLPTCSSQKNCGSCVSHSSLCVWCSSLDRCSTREGMDKYHLLWTRHECPTSAVDSCEGVPDPIALNPTEAPTNCSSQLYTTGATSANPLSGHPIPFPLYNTVDPSNPDVHIIDPGKEERRTYPAPTPSPKSNETNQTGSDNSSMTIITTISITAVCIAATLVISALLILKLGRPVFSSAKADEAKSCNTEHCTRTLIDQNNQQYSQYQLIALKEDSNTVIV